MHPDMSLLPPLLDLRTEVRWEEKLPLVRTIPFSALPMVHHGARVECLVTKHSMFHGKECTLVTWIAFWVEDALRELGCAYEMWDSKKRLKALGGGKELLNDCVVQVNRGRRIASGWLAAAHRMASLALAQDTCTCMHCLTAKLHATDKPSLAQRHLAQCKKRQEHQMLKESVEHLLGRMKRFELVIEKHKQASDLETIPEKNEA
jgi:hypothetical protein